MWILLIILFILAGIVILFIQMTKAFRTIPVDYSSTPRDLGLEYDAAGFPTRNNLNLHGWWIPSNAGRNKPLLILLHGWRRNMERMMPYIKELHSHYNLFVFDSRNHGKSDSDSFSSMPRFAEDIIAALDHIQEAHSEHFSGKIGAIGLSMGGAAAIYAAAQDTRIRSVVTVGAFANPAEVMRLEYKKRKIPYFPMVYLVFEYFQFHMGKRFSEFAPEANIANAEAVFFIVHGKKDQPAPHSHAERLLMAARQGNAELFMIEEAGHSDCHEHETFWPAVKKFLVKSLH